MTGLRVVLSTNAVGQNVWKVRTIRMGGGGVSNSHAKKLLRLLNL